MRSVYQLVAFFLRNSGSKTARKRRKNGRMAMEKAPPGGSRLDGRIGGYGRYWGVCADCSRDILCSLTTPYSPHIACRGHLPEQPINVIREDDRKWAGQCFHSSEIMRNDRISRVIAATARFPLASQGATRGTSPEWQVQGAHPQGQKADHEAQTTGITHMRQDSMIPLSPKQRDAYSPTRPVSNQRTNHSRHPKRIYCRCKDSLGERLEVFQTAATMSKI